MMKREKILQQSESAAMSMTTKKTKNSSNEIDTSKVLKNLSRLQLKVLSRIEKRKHKRYPIVGAIARLVLDIENEVFSPSFSVVNVSKSGFCLIDETGSKLLQLLKGKKFVEVEIFLPLFSILKLKARPVWNSKKLFGFEIKEFETEREKQLYEEYIDEIVSRAASIAKRRFLSRLAKNL